jgi:hypothetical protein
MSSGTARTDVSTDLGGDIKRRGERGCFWVRKQSLDEFLRAFVSVTLCFWILWPLRNLEY